MRRPRLDWRLWDQGRAIDNARVASVELSRLRVEREEVDLYLARRVTAAAAGARDRTPARGSVGDRQPDQGRAQAESG